MKSVTIYPEHVQGAVIGLVFGILLTGSVWIGVSLVNRPNTTLLLAELAECSDKGWITVYFPEGGQYSCTTVDQKKEPVAARKFKRTKKPEKVEPPKLEEKPAQ